MPLQDHYDQREALHEARCARPAAPLSSGARDWPEDFAGENGNYANHCIYCQQTFVGHKRRMVCRECFTESKRKFEALSPEDQMALLEKARQEVAEYMAKRLNTVFSEPGSHNQAS